MTRSHKPARPYACMLSGARPVENIPRRWPGESERGAVVLFFIIIIAIALAGIPMAGLVYDGGRALSAKGRAVDLAGQAARAGTTAISRQSLYTGDPADVRLDPAAAQAAAHRLLAAAGADGTVTIIGNDTVKVTAHVPRRAAILTVVGISDISGRATAEATILHGVTTGAR